MGVDGVEGVEGNDGMDADVPKRTDRLAVLAGDDRSEAVVVTGFTG